MQCSTCKFWSNEGLFEGDQLPENAGYCRRDAPILILGDSELIAVWPFTYGWWGCGDFEEKEIIK